jgi:HPt (histidine-containing phosphotransfer) domain-containing protein
VTGSHLTVLHQIPEGGNDINIDMDKGKMKEESKVPWNMSKTTERLDGDEALFREVMEIFLEQAPKHLAALLVAVEQRQAETVEATAHTLKGELAIWVFHRYCKGPSKLKKGDVLKTLAVSPVFCNSKRISTVCLLRYAVRRPWSGTAYDNCGRRFGMGS